MKIHRFFASAIIAMAAASPFAHSAENIVKAADIVNALSSVPKAVQGSDGRWLQRDPSIDLQVQFDFNKGQLSALGEQQLDELATAFKQPALQGFAFEVAGHTDKVGTAAYNLKLSSERAYAARDYLVRRQGIAAERIVARGYGFDRLADPAQPTAAINRRVEIRRLPGAPGVAAQPVPLQQGQPLPAGGGVIIQRQ